MDWKGHPLITAVIMKRECKEQEEELDQNHGESLFSSPWFWRRRKRKRKKNTPVERRRARKEPWLERKGFLLGVGTYLERAKCAFQTRPLRYVLCMCSVPYICVRESSEKWWRSRGGEGGGGGGWRGRKFGKERRKEGRKERNRKERPGHGSLWLRQLSRLSFSSTSVYICCCCCSFVALLGLVVRPDTSSLSVAAREGGHGSSEEPEGVEA